MYEMKNEKIEKLECKMKNYYELTEQDFYPPLDDRVYTSGIDDIEDGDSFAEYAEYFWEEYGHELYDDIEM